MTISRLLSVLYVCVLCVMQRVRLVTGSVTVYDYAYLNVGKCNCTSSQNMYTST